MKRKHWTVARAAADTPLLEFLAEALNLSKRRAKGLLDARVVFVNDRRVWMARHVLRAGDRIQVHVPDEEDGAAAIPVLYRDDQILVANKPAGRVSNGPDSVESVLREALHLPNLAAVHRLDRDTTGCLMLACDGGRIEPLVKLFRDHAVTKIYRAIVLGAPTPGEGALSQPLDGKRALTRYRVIGTGPRASLVRLRIETGRTHQIRKHLAAIGHPVAGDTVYGTAAVRDPALKALPRQMLHAETLRFPHPVQGIPIEVRAPVPNDFAKALRRLEIR